MAVAAAMSPRLAAQTGLPQRRARRARCAAVQASPSGQQNRAPEGVPASGRARGEERAVVARAVAGIDAPEVAQSAAETMAAEEQKAALRAKRAERAARRKTQQNAYLGVAVASTAAMTLAVAGVIWWRYTREGLHGESGVEQWVEMFGIFGLTCGAAFGMELWAQWAHDKLWHNSLWSYHESHHKPREGMFEKNDVFALVNAPIAIALAAYGFLNDGLGPAMCFGAGMGISLFGMSYMFVHDGLVHRRFPVGPLGDVPYLRRVALAHKMHHSEKYGGVPWGLFLGPLELEAVGAKEDLDRMMAAQTRGDSKEVDRIAGL